MAGRKSSPRPKSRRKVKRKGFWARLFAWSARKIVRRVKRRWGLIRERIEKAFEPAVVMSTKNGANLYPDPRRPAPFTMTRQDPEDAQTYEATFDGLLVVAFTVPPYATADLPATARAAAEAEHGPIAQSWILTQIEGANEAGCEALAGYPGGVLKP
jgi:hypothetical protein